MEALDRVAWMIGLCVLFYLIGVLAGWECWGRPLKKLRGTEPKGE